MRGLRRLTGPLPPESTKSLHVKPGTSWHVVTWRKIYYTFMTIHYRVNYRAVYHTTTAIYYTMTAIYYRIMVMVIDFTPTAIYYKVTAICCKIMAIYCTITALYYTITAI